MSVLERVQEQELQQPPAPSAEGDRLGKARSSLKHDLVERLGLGPLAQMVDSAAPSRAREELAVACEAILNSAAYSQVEEADKPRLVQDVIDEVVGLGPIQPLLDDDSVSEVMVNGRDSLFFERGGELFRSERTFESDEQILTIVDRIIAPLGRRLDERNPIVNARLANGDRVNAVIRSVAIDGPVVTIRKFSNRISSLEELVGLGALPAWYAQLLAWAVRLRQDIAVAGGTGSGKTTLLNALSCEIPAGERIITIEDSAELRFDSHPHVVRLEARDASIEGVGEVTIRDLVRNSLRMRPDRIVVGEVRGPECIDMLQAVNTGHDGSLTTLHAGTPREAILRLVLMARFGMDLPVDIVEDQIASGLDVLVMSHRLADGTRLIGSASTIGRAPEGGVELREFVRLEEASRTWRLVDEPRFLAAAVRDGLLQEGEVARWRASASR
ncbi:MAG: CpaF family protein [Atopobiaceae bacterium]|jgi:pilus assembly protein CpaF|nr:CpaF family protein [Atopobiaceae bacterium]MCH4119484.1 CpaF family protein [Atopobiaceae bacterium]MCI1318642.1 CpaF family protein [Atopobiaceae bacterium]MCI1389071.1 CpaF family protein [Atopobiaceae bacterium]MCI1431695.1 CpaF family protein [Atopobiaceae bacterium]